LWKSYIEHSREQWLTIYYDGIKVGSKRVDFVIQGVLLEIKAKGQIENQDYIQTLSYLKASGYQIGLLVNFGESVIKVKRLIN
jgi:GxxExxY protein